MTWNCQLVHVKEVVLNSLLIVLIRIKVVVLKVVQKSTRDGTDAFNVVYCGRKLLLAVLNGVLQILQCEDEL